MTAGSQPGTGAPPQAASPSVQSAPSSEQVTSLMIDQAKRLNPLASAWWIGLIQGSLAAALGLLFWMRPTGAAGVLLQFVALFLVIVGLMDLMAGMSGPRRDSAESIAFWRGLVGFFGGLIMLSLVFLGYFNAPERVALGMTLMGIILLAYGALGIVLSFMRKQKQGRWTAFTLATIITLLGLSLMVDRVTTFAAAWIGPILLILGVVLIVYSVLRRSWEREALEEPA